MALAMLVSIGGFSGASYASEASKTQKVLLLDIGGLFLKFSGWEYGKRIGLCNIVAYAVRDIKNPAKMKQIIFGVLNQVDMEQDEDLKPTCTTSGDTLPYILCAYQAGRITDEEARELAFETFDKLKEEGHFVSDREADIVKSALTLMFTPEISAACNKELHDGTKLLEMMANEVDEQGKKKYLIKDKDIYTSSTWIASYVPSKELAIWMAKMGWDEAEYIKREAGAKGSRV